jgi:hypothetical protein
VIFKYFIEFDDDGEIRNFYKLKEDCKNCKEYLVKLIPVDRKLETFGQKASQLDKAIDKMLQGRKKLDTEFNKVVRDLRRIKV